MVYKTVQQNIKFEGILVLLWFISSSQGTLHDCECSCLAITVIYVLENYFMVFPYGRITNKIL